MDFKTKIKIKNIIVLLSCFMMAFAYVCGVSISVFMKFLLIHSIVCILAFLYDLNARLRRDLDN